MKRRHIFGLLLASATSLAAQANLRLYVDETASGANDGSSWTNAHTTLQAALTAAGISAGEPVEIWVADGTYKPGTAPSSTFTIPTGVKLFGGFAGGETQLSQRDWKMHLTILSGEIGDPTATLDNISHVVTVTGAGAGTLLDGFTIERGHAGDVPGDGGLARIANSAVRFQHCTFRDGTAAENGGAVAITGASAASFVFCDFAGCTSGAHGGAIRNESNAPVYAVCTRFLGNHALGNGGAISSIGGALRLHNAVFASNQSVGDGGAMFLYGAAAIADVRNCTLRANSGARGGGIRALAGASVTVKNSILTLCTDTDPTTFSEEEEVLATNGAVASVTYTMITGYGGGALNGIGNFNGNATFFSAAGDDGVLGTLDDDLRLRATSSGIDRGLNAAAPEDDLDLDGDGITTEKIPFDILGNPRVYDIAAQFNQNNSAIDNGAYEAHVIPGDMNCDGVLNNFDIDPFVLALTNPDAWATLNPTCDIIAGDCNGDAWFNNFDIDPFVMCVTNLGCP